MSTAVAAFCARESIGDLPGWLRRRVLTQGATLAELAEQVGLSIPVTQRLLDEHRLRPTGPAVRGRVRRSRAQSRRQRRLRELGFAGLPDYLRDRYSDQGCTVAVLRAELGCRDTVLTEAIGRYRLTRPTTPAEHERLRRCQARSHQLAADRATHHRQLLATLGFADVPSYLRSRYLDDHATVTAMAREPAPAAGGDGRGRDPPPAAARSDARTAAGSAFDTPPIHRRR